MKNLLLTSWIIMMLAMSVMAQNDNKAQTILNEVSAKTKAYKTIRMEFIYKMENTSQNINESYNGVLISKGDMYKLSVSGQDVISNGKTVWTYIKDANEVQVNNVSNDEDSFTPTNLLSTYTENFKSKLISETAQLQTIELTPIQKKNFTKVRIIIDRTKKMVNTISIFDKNGSVYSYIVNKMEVNKPYADNMFNFTTADHPGVEEIDMR